MANNERRLDHLHAALGHKPLNRTWAKLEILFGLAAAGGGILLGQWLCSRHDDPDGGMVGAALVLFVLGGYLALAGSRSHMYQSNNELTALLLEELSRSRPQS